MNTRNFIIIKYLKEVGEYVTAESLSALCHVSTKTILKDIAQFKKIVALSNLIQRIYHNDIRNMLP